jgi:hypothetical protein
MRREISRLKAKAKAKGSGQGERGTSPTVREGSVTEPGAIATGS